MKKLILAVILTWIPGIALAQEYTLQRGSLIDSDGFVLDTLRGDMSATGTMSINGTNIKQSLTVCVATDCTPSNINWEIRSVGVNTSTVRVRDDDFNEGEIVIVSLNPLITLLVSFGITEMNHWMLTQNLSSTSNQINETIELETDISDVSGLIFESPISKALRKLEEIQGF